MRVRERASACVCASVSECVCVRLPSESPAQHQLNEVKRATFLRSMFTPMLVMPGHPTSGPFYLVKGLLNATGRYSWSPASPHKLAVYVALIPLLAGYAQVGGGVRGGVTRTHCVCVCLCECVCLWTEPAPVPRVWSGVE